MWWVGLIQLRIGIIVEPLWMRNCTSGSQKACSWLGIFRIYSRTMWPRSQRCWRKRKLEIQSDQVLCGRGRVVMSRNHLCLCSLPNLSDRFIVNYVNWRTKQFTSVPWNIACAISTKLTCTWPVGKVSAFFIYFFFIFFFESLVDFIQWSALACRNLQPSYACVHFFPPFNSVS